MVNETLPSRPQVMVKLTGEVWRKSALRPDPGGQGLTSNDLAQKARSLISRQERTRSAQGALAGNPPLLLQVAPANRGRRDWRSEQPVKERRPGIAARKGNARRQQAHARRARIAGRRVRDHILQIPGTTVLQDLHHGRIAAIDVLADLQLAGLIH